jgi:hemolysin activation/secretion protein
LIGQRLQIEESLPPVDSDSLITVPDESGNQVALHAGAGFTLSTIALEDLTVFTAEQLRPYYESYLGKTVTLNDLTQIANAITAHYRSAGYILSRAYVPPQRVENGVVEIRIVEGSINRVRFEGVPTTSGWLAEYADKIQNAKPLDAPSLERYLLLINDLPGVSAHAVIQPSADTPGTADVVVMIQEKIMDGSLTVDNRGTRYMGPVEGGLTLNANNVLGLYDQTQLRGVGTTQFDEMHYAEIVHTEQLDSEGTKLAVSAGYTHTAPDYKLAPFEIEGRDDVFSLDVSHPFLRSRQANLFGDVKFDVRQTDTSSLNVPLYDDRLRVLRAGGSYDYVDDFAGINKVETELSKGFDWDAASSVGARSRATGEPDFVKETAQASRLQPIGGPVNLYVAATGQWSADTLLTSEQFGIGGAEFGSAYDPSEIAGDSGLAGRAELQYARSGDLEYVQSFQLYGFYDIGAVWLRNPSNGQNPEASLADTGVGLRFNVMESLSGGLECALPLTRSVAADGQDGKRPRAFFSLAYRY